MVSDKSQVASAQAKRVSANIPTALLEIQGLSVHSKHHAILQDVTLALHPGEVLCIVGPSGAGKSTLLRACNRLSDLESGLRVTGDIRYRDRSVFNGVSLMELRRCLGMVFQKPCVFPGSIRRNVLFGARHHRRLTAAGANSLAESMLRRVHLWDDVKHRLHHPARELSAGQQQRLSLARALAVDPDVLLLDEPTANLDPHSTLAIEQALLELKSAKAVMLVTHSLEQARRVADRVVLLSASSGAGRIVEESPVEQFFSQPRETETRAYVNGQASPRVPQ